MSKKLLMAAIAAFSLVSADAFACACGCGVFDVGTGTMMPTDKGGTVWLEYDHLDQNHNWSGTNMSDGSNNPDKQLDSEFFTAGGQYMFNRSWGVEAEVPYTARFFASTDDDSGDPTAKHHSALGDIRVRGIYSGFSDDMSTGMTYGLKLPTGDSGYKGFDRDTAIGTGDTEWLLGAYHMGALTDDRKFDWFVNGQWEHAFTVSDHYRPGDEFDAALGSYYEAGAIFGADRVAPLLQLIGSYRLHDVGANADPQDSGYRRLLISPGIEYDTGPVKLYADVETPLWQNVNGNQLVAPVLTKFIVGYSF